jgi:hypothetical protein
MEQVLSSFRDLCDHPFAWLLLAAALLKALGSTFVYFRCPVMRAGDLPPPEQARRMVEGRFLHSPRFLLTMSLGLGLAVGGLYGLSHPDYGTLALAAIVVGVFIMVVEPSQLSIEENMLRVVAAQTRDQEMQSLAMDRLRGSHLERIGLEWVLALALGLMMWLY